jgi:hypothetical protein
MTISQSTFYNLNIESFNLASTGLTGDTGLTGPRGATGPSLLGITGNTGASLSNITQLQNYTLRFDYSDNQVNVSQAIRGPVGEAKISLTGQSMTTSFSPLKDSLANQNISGSPTDVLTFKNFKSAASPVVSISYNTTSNPSDIIYINYNNTTLGYVGISGSEPYSIVNNTAGQKQKGITGSLYNTGSNAILIQHKNVREGIVTVSPVNLSSSFAYWKIDATKGTIFNLLPNNTALSTSGQISGGVILIRKPIRGSLSKGITLYFSDGFKVNSTKLYYALYDDDSDITSGITFSNTFQNNFDLSGVVFQYDSYFCPEANQYNVLNLISLGSRYLAIPAKYNADTPTSTTDDELDVSCNPFTTTTDVRLSFAEYDNLNTGICCPISCGSSGAVSTYNDCEGYFYNNLSLSGNTYCNKLGVCCIDLDGLYTQSESTFCSCATNAGSHNFIWNPYTALKKNINDFNCSAALYNRTGACCDGVGGCVENLTKEQCQANNNFFQGLGTKCVTIEGNNVCQSGFGACCDSGVTCNNGITASYCFSNNRTYFGESTNCLDYTCESGSIPCLQTIQGSPEIRVGDEFADGVVVGLFDPTSSPVFGNASFFSKFVKTSSEVDSIIDLQISEDNIEYSTKYDYSGYGFDSQNTCDSNDKFIIVVGTEDIEYNSSNTFVWSKSQCMWGPLFEPSTVEVSEINETSIKLKEGYVYEFGSESSKLTSLRNTFANCNLVRNDTDSIDWLSNRLSMSLNGNWTRNYGLYNTERIIGSKFMEIQGIDQGGATAAFYVGLTSIDGDTIASAIIDYNIQNPPSNDYESSWFIPSHDEMAYILRSCLQIEDININSQLSILGHQRIEGKYWTSTGAFSLDEYEGVFGATGGLTHGSMAYSFSFDSIYSENNYSIKEDRTNKYKVRPIKIIRCNGNYAVPGDQNYKLWRIPLIAES